MAELIITIDGPAASGKSTAARLLAQKLGASFLDTGAMYRAVTYAALKENINLENENDLLNILQKNNFRYIAQNEQMIVHINGIDITERLRDPLITSNAKYIASVPKVRERLVQIQRQFASEHKKIVTEGRDQGTVAFPDADVKFFLTADPAERAKRRQAELQTKGTVENLEKIQSDIEQRDKSDWQRKIGPLKPASDAIELNTTDLSIDQVVDKLLEYVSSKNKRTS